MVIVHIVIGISALAVGLFSVVKRKAIFARHQRRARQGLGPSQSPAAYAVIGVILTLVGLTQLLQALV